MNRITVAHWFSRTIQKPLIAAAIAIALIQLLMVGYFSWVNRQARSESLLRFNEEVSLGISQQNRTLIESALAHAKAELNADSIALCQGSHAVLSTPASENPCSLALGNELLEKRISILGHAEFAVYVSVSFFKEFGLQFGVLSASAALIITVLLLFFRSSRNLQRDFVKPMQLDFSLEEELNKSISSMEITEVANIYTAHLAQVKSIRHLAAENERMARLAAIAQVTQMLAHDVRRPMQLVRTTFDLLKKAKTLEQIEKITTTASANINKAMNQAEGLISDVMELGAKSDVVTEPTAPAMLFQDAIENVSDIYPNADVAISVDVKTQNMVLANRAKMERVISNIIGNAYQALGQKGQVWLAACDDIRAEGAFVRFTIGNNGPCISKEDLPKLFDSFFTKGKAGGTGLGLAIAHKIVFAHGGSIWCESGTSAKHPEGFVEFKFVLPC